MKKLTGMILIFAMLCVAWMSGCGSAQSNAASVDLNTCTYEEFIAYLQAKGFIDKNAVPVDMNATAGYLVNELYDDDFNIVGYQSFSDKAYAFADKAKDYNGLYVIWYDTAEGAAFQETWESLSYGIYLGDTEVSYPMVFAEDYSSYGMIPQLAANGSSFLLGFADDFDADQKEEILADFAALKVALPENNAQ